MSADINQLRYIHIAFNSAVKKISFNYLVKANVTPIMVSKKQLVITRPKRI